MADYGKQVSEYATLLYNDLKIAEIVPCQKPDNAIVHLIVKCKPRKERISDDDGKEDDKLTALNVYSKRDSPFCHQSSTPSLRAARVHLVVRHRECSNVGIFLRVASEGTSNIRRWPPT